MLLPCLTHPTTPDGRYFVVKGRLWRTSDPNLDASERERLVKELMRLRRLIGQAMREEDREKENEARARLHEVKVALGERGPPWWEDGAPDYNRRLVQDTPYKEWYESLADGTD